MRKGIEVLPYDPRWPLEFEAEKDRIAGMLGSLALRIDHHGSTAVPGLPAKPIIDIQVSVGRLQPMQGYLEPLTQLGYEHVSHVDDAVCPFFHRPHDWPHTHHVHVVEFGGAEERRTLAFRDYLIYHPEVAREYAALKHRLARQYDAGDPEERERYAIAKSDFIERVLKIALGQGYPRHQCSASELIEHCACGTFENAR